MAPHRGGGRWSGDRAARPGRSRARVEMSERRREERATQGLGSARQHVRGRAGPGRSGRGGAGQSSDGAAPVRREE
ncbi:hypothetical protein GUJ93_ZPchr0006g40627 [Zizania palustris]|uniref:Uncharacterized protein n=1 Tax=Zizania palustris TaxID=103762 RepID=A0A8J5T200_ZIZPA|nr:hypothetical protein GUJ93_ZPchr0006g40627 [Zizania palustris]